jgi:hypothetical protein
MSASRSCSWTARRARSFEHVTLAVSAQRFFLVCWDPPEQHKRTIVADRKDVRAAVISVTDEPATIGLTGPWGSMEVGDDLVSHRFQEIVDLLNTPST